MNKRVTIIKNYECYWCGFEFEEEIGVYKPGQMSSQIRCPSCGNFIETWKKILTGEIVGRKHIHLGR